MFLLQPLAFAKYIQASTVYYKIDRAIRVSTWLHRQYQPRPTTRKGREIRNADIHTHKLNKAAHEPFGLAPRLFVNHPTHQKGRDCKIRINGLTALRPEKLCSPCCFCLTAQPNCHIPALTRAFIMRGPVCNPIPLLLELVTTGGIECMRHQRYPKIRKTPNNGTPGDP